MGKQIDIITEAFSDLAPDYSLIISLIALTCYSALFLVLSRPREANGLYRSIKLYLLSMILWSFGATMIFAQTGIWDALFWNRFKIVGSMAMPITFFYFVSVLLQKDRRWWLFLGLLLYTVTQVANLLGEVVTDVYITNGQLHREYGMAIALPSVVWVLFIVLSSVDLIRAYRSARDVVYRNRLKYLMLVILVIFAGSLTKATQLRFYPVDIFFNIIGALLIAYTITRHNLLNINIVVRKGMLYTILTTLSHRISVVIENARLYETEQLKRREAEILRETTTALISTLDIDQVLDSILVYLAKVVAYDSACVFLLDTEGKRLHVKGGRGFSNPERVLGKDYPSDDPLTQTIQQSKKPLIIRDAQKDPRFQAWGGTEYVHGWMGVPLLMHGEMIGLLTLDSKKPDAFREVDGDLTQTFANQAAISIENARLYEAARQRAEEADTLRQAAAAVIGNLQQEQAIQAILEQLRRVVPYDSASVQLLGQGYLEIVGGKGWDDLSSVIGMRFPIPGDNPNTSVIQQKRPYILGEAPQAYKPFREEPHSHINSWMGVPLLVQDRIIGMLALDQTQPNFFTSHHATNVAAFADQVAIVLENARLFASERQRAEELATLYSTSTAMSSHIEQQQVLEEITRQTTLALNGTSCYVSIIDQTGDHVKVVAEYFSPEANPLETKSDLGEVYPLTLADKNQLQNQQAVVTHRNDPDADTTMIEEMTKFGGKTVLSLPLTVRGQRIGFLELWDSRTERDFSDAEIRLGQTIANQAAISLEHARLYENERRRAAQMEGLRATATDITAELDLPKLLHMILGRAISLLDASGGDLGLYDKETSELEIVTSHNMGKDYAGTRMVMGEGVMGRVASSLQPLIIEDYSTWEGRSPQYLEGSWHAAMGSPLMVHGELVGAIGVVDDDPSHKFTQDDLELLNLSAQQAAIAIENARLFDSEKRRTKELDALHKATAALLTTLDLETLLNHILAEAMHSIPEAEKGTLLLLDHGTGELSVRSMEGPTDIRVKKVVVSEEKGYATRAMQLKEPLLLEDLTQDMDLHYEVKIVKLNSARSAIVAPMMLEDTLLGALSLESTSRSAFTKADLNLLISFANTATAAIRNAQLHAEVQKLAVTDSLTGLFNRRGLFELGEREIDRVRRFNHPLSAIMLDIDFFKNINDTYSHAIGDQVLCALAHRCRTSLRDIDILGRYGGEEFAILLPETDTEDAIQVAERLRKEVSRSPVETDFGPISFTISLGVTTARRDTPELAVLLDRADTAMYAAKRAGRNRIAVSHHQQDRISIASPKE